jgi:uracil-DNA glycosylase
MGKLTRLEKSAADFLPTRHDLPSLAQAAEGCRGCPLYANATQTVFGEGPPDAHIVLVGEQPGDVEDKQGHPFVGPAGGVLDRALAEVGLDRDEVYLTNAVKHFSFTPQGKRRIHKTPSLHDLVACKPWLDAELEELHPEVVVCLGATATRSVLGPGHSVTKERGQVLRADDGPAYLITTHPSAVLRATDRRAAFAGLTADLAVAASAAAPAAAGHRGH